MAITTAMCNSFKSELLGGIHDLDTDNIYIALIKDSPAGTYGANTTNYSNITDNNDEAATSGGYPAGGQQLDSPSITLDGSTATVDFADETFVDVTVTASGAIMYNASQGNKAIAVFNFGGDITSTDGDFTIVFPTADASNAVIRIA